MTRKDPHLIAIALAACRPNDHWCPNKREQWRLCVRNIASLIGSLGFDADEFTNNCRSADSQIAYDGSEQS